MVEWLFVSSQCTVPLNHLSSEHLNISRCHFHSFHDLVKTVDLPVFIPSVVGEVERRKNISISQP